MDNTPLALTMELNKRWSDKTVVYYDSFNSDNRLVKYFNLQTIWVHFGSFEEIETAAPQVYRAGGTVWLETSVIERLKSSKPLPEELPANLIERERIELVNKSYNLKFLQIIPANSEDKSL